MEPNQRIEYVLSTLIRYRKLWIVPAVAGFLLALVYVLLIRGETWTARQSLIVRDDLLGQSFKPGQFSSLESMKSAQETILEIARKPLVIRNVLATMGPQSKSLFFNSGNYPDDATIEDVQGLISFSAPNGAEFGKTEVIILNAKSNSPQRARQFIGLLLDEMDVHISEVRAQRLQSMESELAMTRDGAALSLDQSMEKLREMEDKLGADVGTMNGLNSTQPGDGSAKMEIAVIQGEKRAAQAQLDSALTAQQMLTDAKMNPERMLATSADFLKLEPKLEALSKSLVDAQKAYADNSGRYELQHPLLQQSLETIAVMREQIYQELGTLTVSVESRIDELRNRIDRLDDLTENQRDRLVELGSKRVDHWTINSQVDKKAEIYNLAESKLSEVQALRMATGKIEWLTRMGEPQLATRPDGMGKKSTVLAGGFCGLLLGLGLVMLVAPPMELNPPQSAHGRPGRRTDVARRVTGAGDNKEIAAVTNTSDLAAIESSVTPLALPQSRKSTPSLDEMVGPTAAAAIQSASAATVATVNKGVSMAKSALSRSSTPKQKDNSKQPIIIPDVSKSEPAENKSMSDTRWQKLKSVEPQCEAVDSTATTTEMNVAEIVSPAKQDKHTRPKQDTPSVAEPTLSKKATPAAAEPAFGRLDNTSRPAENDRPSIVPPAVVTPPNQPQVVLETPEQDSIPTVEDSDKEIEFAEPTPQYSASDVLAELRANRARQTEPKIKPSAGTESTPTGSFGPVQPRRASNQRPFDLARMTGEEDSADESDDDIDWDAGSDPFAEHVSTYRPLPGKPATKPATTTPSRTTESTQSLDAFMAARESFEIEQEISYVQRSMLDKGVDTASVNKALKEPKENPFLKHPPYSNSSSEKPTEKKVDSKSQEFRAVTPTRSTTDSQTLPIPDQIRNLADSIANFANPKKPRS